MAEQVIAIAEMRTTNRPLMTGSKLDPDAKLVLQRLRNRVIDYLEMVSSLDRQLQYQSKAPDVSVAAEVINQWEDWVDSSSWRDVYLPPVVSHSEINAMSDFHRVWEQVINDLPSSLPNLHQLADNSEWKRLAEAASAALKVFQTRGRLPEDDTSPDGQ